ncbi:MAG: lipoyl synthase [Nitrospina sp.]|nr:lipoyl synthase [Nitrospina sp.]
MLNVHRPKWIKAVAPSGENYLKVKQVLETHGLHTVCESANCPNVGGCFDQLTATFLILGDTCTRSCRFCAVVKGFPGPLDKNEPTKVSLAVKELGLNYVAITSVTRDDLPDGGAEIFAETILSLKRTIPECRIEVLIPDFQGSHESLIKVIEAGPDVINHNMETIERLYAKVRPQADYRRSLEVIETVLRYDSNIVTKSGIMLGFGEAHHEILQTFTDLVNAGCKSLTIGQYLSPSHNHLPVKKYYSPQEYKYWHQVAEDTGFNAVESGPLVRSSYHAAVQYNNIRKSQN